MLLNLPALIFENHFCMKSFRLFVALLTVFILFHSCKTKQDNKEITTAIVNNTVTTDGEYEKGTLPKFKFEKRTHDFGEIIQGEQVSYTFKYKNVGGSDLVLRQAKGSCGCTVPQWSKEPLAPGEEAEIEIIFNSSGKKGNQRKTMTLLANTQPNKEVLTIIGEIISSNE